VGETGIVKRGVVENQTRAAEGAESTPREPWQNKNLTIGVPGANPKGNKKKKKGKKMTRLERILERRVQSTRGGFVSGPKKGNFLGGEGGQWACVGLGGGLVKGGGAKNTWATKDTAKKLGKGEPCTGGEVGGERRGFGQTQGYSKTL